MENNEVIEQNILDKLNNSIDRVIADKNRYNLDYEFIEETLEKLLKDRRIVGMGKTTILTNVSKEQALREILQFFKSVDEEFCNKAIKVILQQNEKVKMNIYNINSIRRLDKEDENGIEEYDYIGSVSSNRGKATVHIPLGEDLNAENTKKIGSTNHCTIDDLCTIVHEISHLFDFEIDDTLPSRNKLLNPDIRKGLRKYNLTRELLTETTATVFEGIFADYLLQNTKYCKTETKQNIITKQVSFLIDAQYVHAKLFLAREKEKSGIISQNFIKQTMKQKHLSKSYVKYLATCITKDIHNMQFERRYAFAGLIAPTIIKKYRQNPKEGAEQLKKYLSYVKQDNFEEALGVFGITWDREGIDQMIRNVKEEEYMEFER